MKTYENILKLIAVMGFISAFVIPPILNAIHASERQEAATTVASR